jgi:hypothetical protein
LVLQLDGAPERVEHGKAWWLDAVTRQMVEQRLNLNGMLTFTLRGGRPINLSREQVCRKLHHTPALFVNLPQEDATADSPGSM